MHRDIDENAKAKLLIGTLPKLGHAEARARRSPRSRKVDSL